MRGGTKPAGDGVGRVPANRELGGFVFWLSRLLRMAAGAIQRASMAPGSSNICGLPTPAAAGSCGAGARIQEPLRNWHWVGGVVLLRPGWRVDDQQGALLSFKEIPGLRKQPSLSIVALGFNPGRRVAVFGVCAGVLAGSYAAIAGRCT